MDLSKINDAKNCVCLWKDKDSSIVKYDLCFIGAIVEAFNGASQKS